MWETQEYSNTDSSTVTVKMFIINSLSWREFEQPGDKRLGNLGSTGFPRNQSYPCPERIQLERLRDVFPEVHGVAWQAESHTNRSRTLIDLSKGLST
jgi:hypothetical protein